MGQCTSSKGVSDASGTRMKPPTTIGSGCGAQPFKNAGPLQTAGHAVSGGSSRENIPGPVPDCQTQRIEIKQLEMQKLKGGEVRLV